MKRFIGVVALALALLTNAAPANAAEPARAYIGTGITVQYQSRYISDCLPNATWVGLCFWSGTDYNGTLYRYSHGYISANYGVGLASDPAYPSLPPSNNAADSWYNLDQTITIYDSSTCNYGSGPYYPSSWNRSLVRGQHAVSPGSDWGSRMSSFTFATFGNLYNCNSY